MAASAAGALQQAAASTGSVHGSNAKISQRLAHRNATTAGHGDRGCRDRQSVPTASCSRITRRGIPNPAMSKLSRSAVNWA